jgi:hypothetical protein
LVAVEAGHPRAELGKLLTLLAELGLTLDLSPAEAREASGSGDQPPVIDLDELLESHDTKRRSGSAP